jgi:hypothetical protein
MGFLGILTSLHDFRFSLVTTLDNLRVSLNEKIALDRRSIVTN